MLSNQAKLRLLRTVAVSNNLVITHQATSLVANRKTIKLLTLRQFLNVVKMEMEVASMLSTA